MPPDYGPQPEFPSDESPSPVAVIDASWKLQTKHRFKKAITNALACLQTTGLPNGQNPVPKKDLADGQCPTPSFKIPEGMTLRDVARNGIPIPKPEGWEEHKQRRGQVQRDSRLNRGPRKPLVGGGVQPKNTLSNSPYHVTKYTANERKNSQHNHYKQETPWCTHCDKATVHTSETCWENPANKDSNHGRGSRESNSHGRDSSGSDSNWQSHRQRKSGDRSQVSDAKAVSSSSYRSGDDTSPARITEDNGVALPYSKTREMDTADVVDLSNDDTPAVEPHLSKPTHNFSQGVLGDIHKTQNPVHLTPISSVPQVEKEGKNNFISDKSADYDIEIVDPEKKLSKPGRLLEVEFQKEIPKQSKDANTQIKRGGLDIDQDLKPDKPRQQIITSKQEKVQPRRLEIERRYISSRPQKVKARKSNLRFPIKEIFRPGQKLHTGRESDPDFLTIRLVGEKVQAWENTLPLTAYEPKLTALSQVGYFFDGHLVDLQLKNREAVSSSLHITMQFWDKGGLLAFLNALPDNGPSHIIKESPFFDMRRKDFMQSGQKQTSRSLPKDDERDSHEKLGISHKFIEFGISEGEGTAAALKQTTQHVEQENTRLKLQDRMQGPGEVDELYALRTKTKDRKSDQAETTVAVTYSCAGGFTRPTRQSLQKQVIAEVPSPPSPRRPIFDPPRLLWNEPLRYPFQLNLKGESVNPDDMATLKDNEFVNDEIINTYIRYLDIKLKDEGKPDLAKTTYFFNTFFYESITRKEKGTTGINYEKVRRWMPKAKENLFEKKYVFVPINQNAHWYLALIYNLPELIKRKTTITHSSPSEQLEQPGPLYSGKARTENELESRIDDSQVISDLLEPQHVLKQSNVALRPPQTRKSGGHLISIEDSESIHRRNAPKAKKVLDLNSPCIFILDSLDVNKSVPTKNLREFVVKEAKDKLGIDINGLDIASVPAKVPQQHNMCDCGIYMLQYIECFLKSPEGIIQFMQDRGKTSDQERYRNWDVGDMQNKRGQIFCTFVALKAEHDEYLRQHSKLEKPSNEIENDDDSDISIIIMSSQPPTSPAPEIKRAGHECAVASDIRPMNLAERQDCTALADIPPHDPATAQKLTVTADVKSPELTGNVSEDEAMLDMDSTSTLSDGHESEVSHEDRTPEEAYVHFPETKIEKHTHLSDILKVRTTTPPRTTGSRSATVHDAAVPDNALPDNAKAELKREVSDSFENAPSELEHADSMSADDDAGLNVNTDLIRSTDISSADDVEVVEKPHKRKSNQEERLLDVQDRPSKKRQKSLPKTSSSPPPGFDQQPRQLKRKGEVEEHPVAQDSQTPRKQQKTFSGNSISLPADDVDWRKQPKRKSNEEVLLNLENNLPLSKRHQPSSVSSALSPLPSDMITPSSISNVRTFPEMTPELGSQDSGEGFAVESVIDLT